MRMFDFCKPTSRRWRGEYPGLGPRQFGLHTERPDISAFGSQGGSDMFDTTNFHPVAKCGEVC